MAEILLMNPRRRRRRKNPSYSHRKRRRNPKHHRRHRKYAARVMVNPHRRRRRNPFLINPHHRRVRRRNPSLRGLTGSVMPTLKAGFTGAVGAVGLDLLIGAGAKFLPAQLQTGYPLVAMKLLGSVLVGMVGGKLPGLRGHGRDLAVGGATVAIHDAIKPLIAQVLLSLPLSGYFAAGSYAGGSPVATPLLTTGMGRYEGRLGRLGKYVSLSGLSQQTEEIGEYNSGIF